MDLPAVEDMRAILRDLAAGGGRGAVTFACGGQKLSVTQLGPAASGEHLCKLARSIEGMETQLLGQAFGLTPREADVLLWTARGKSNKDMSEILNISARTVNKHLEQIFIKIGVENRASATAAATRIFFRPEREPWPLVRAYRTEGGTMIMCAYSHRRNDPASARCRRL